MGGMPNDVFTILYDSTVSNGATVLDFMVLPNNFYVYKTTTKPRVRLFSVNPVGLSPVGVGAGDTLTFACWVSRFGQLFL